MDGSLPPPPQSPVPAIAAHVFDLAVVTNDEIPRQPLSMPCATVVDSVMKNQLEEVM